MVNLPRLYSAWQSKKHAEYAAAGKKFGEYTITLCAIKNQFAYQRLPTPGLYMPVPED